MQLDGQRPLLTPPGEGEAVTDRPERTIRILGELDELIVSWFRYEPGQKGPDAHVHHHHTDAFYLLEGEVEFTLGPQLQTLTAGPGTFAAAPFPRLDKAETIRHKTSLHRILCDLPQLTAIDMTFEPEFEGVDPHTHGDHADSFYVLEGQVEFHVGDEPRIAGPGTFVSAPPGTVHGFRVVGSEPIRFLNLHAPPGGFLDRLRA